MEIVEYSQTEAGLQELRQKYDGTIYDVASKDGMVQARAARAEIKQLRVNLEAKRKEIKEPALRHCQLIDSEAKRITGELLQLETPIDNQIKAEEARKEAEKAAKAEVERKRVAAIQARIDLFRNAAATAPASSEELNSLIDKIVAVDIDDRFAEFHAEARDAKSLAINTLGGMMTAAQAREEEQVKLQAERAELDRLRKEAETREQAEQERLAAEQKRLDTIKAEEERLRLEREAVARRDRELIEERTRLQESEQARLEQQRLDQERQERIRLENERAEQSRLEALRMEQEQAEREHQERLTASRKGTPAEALAEILRLARETERYPNHAAVRAKIALIAEASL